MIVFVDYSNTNFYNKVIAEKCWRCGYCLQFVNLAVMANETSGDTEQLILKNDNELVEYRLNTNVIIFIINDFLQFVVL